MSEPLTTPPAPALVVTTSEQINELAAALAKAQGEMGAAAKDSSNPFFHSKYADLASVRDACIGPLSTNGLSIVQFPGTEYHGKPEPYEWTAKNSGETRYGVRVVCTVSVRTRLIHASGQWLEGAVSTMLPTGDPQSVGSAITYLRRYALAAVTGVAPEDDDGEGAHKQGPPQRTDQKAAREKVKRTPPAAAASPAHPDDDTSLNKPPLEEQAKAIWDDILLRTAGDADAAHQVLRDITSYSAGTSKTTGRPYAAFEGCRSWGDLDTTKRIAIATERLAKHPIFGNQREPGDDHDRGEPDR